MIKIHGAVLRVLTPKGADRGAVGYASDAALED